MHSYTIHTHTDTLSHTFTHTLHVHSRITALLIWAINVQRESIKTKSNDQFDRTISYALKLPLPPTLLSTLVAMLLGHSMLAYLVAFQRAIKLAIDPLIMRNYQLHCGHFTKPANCVNVRLQGDLDRQQQRDLSQRSRGTKEFV